jgi:hypothetical protein
LLSEKPEKLKYKGKWEERGFGFESQRDHEET